ncbi:MAG TPA: hypothetical protein VHZ97_04355 [Pseudonocardiaceae bacterium]|jgi:hypothetical protein|nr:hypothetical protein [Pseudonocardiaceae bacterium]
MPAGTQIFEIRVGILASEEQAHEVIDRIRHVLCPDPDHRPPCPIPWSIGLVAEAEHLEDGWYPELQEQARIERG